MAKQFPRRQIKIRPLSEGLGLGVLRSPEATARPADLDSSIMRQAHAAYAPHSVGTEMRNRVGYKAYVWMARFAAGAGLDLAVGVVSIVILAWAGVIAWNAGATGVLSPAAALGEVMGFLARMTPKTVTLVVLCVALMVRVVRKFF
jgi:hypothetical protein